MFVLDTNSIIYHFKGMGNVSSHLLSHKPSEIYLSAVVLFELETGLAKSNAPMKRRRLLNTLVNTVTFLPFGLRDAQVAGQIRADLEQKGTPIGQYDVLIAATAVANGAKLVTHNTREFARVVGLQLEDWF